MKNILEVIKKAPEDHVYYCTVFGYCNCSGSDDDEYPIRCDILSDADRGTMSSLTKDGKFFEDTPDSECVLFPSRDNRDWEAFERELDGVKDNNSRFNPPAYDTDSYKNGVLSGYYQVVGMTEINLDHGNYKEFPYIDFQIDGKKYRVSTEDMKRLAMDNADNKTEHILGQSFDGTAEMVSIPDRPMMAAVIMSGMMAYGGMEYNDPTLVNRAVRLADMILDKVETKEETK